MPVPQFLIDRIQNINGHVQQGIPIRSELRKGMEIEEQLGINNGVLRSLAQNMNYFNHQDEIYIDISFLSFRFPFVRVFVSSTPLKISALMK
jgi:hypothetical protein